MADSNFPKPRRAAHSPTESQSSDDRDQTGRDRDLAAAARDRIAAGRDRAAEARDLKAADRDRRAEARELSVDDDPDVAAESDRVEAGHDRDGAAGDRRHAAGDRAADVTDRVASTYERTAASFDDLTGAYRRDTGLSELNRELLRAVRTNEPFVLAFVDVDGLKAVNDSLGHAVGDQLLRRIVAAIRRHIRAYDLIVRFGGDEFLCAFVDLTLEQAAERFALVNADLAQPPRVSISAGLADLREGDSLEDLIHTADTSLRAERNRKPPARD